MRRAALLAVALLAWLPARATGEPAARNRVVLADPDPELRHAMEQALAPWHLEVVIDGGPPRGAAMAQERADADTARFVVWRDGAALVVYDRELGTTERRQSQSGVLDAPTAAAAALTIKTMMRLPPPPDEPEAAPPLPVAAEPGIEIRMQASVSTRITNTAVAVFGGGASLRPWASSGWRFGVAGDLAAPTSVTRAGFTGTWSEWTLVGGVGWTYARGAWELEPRAGFGVRRTDLEGDEMKVGRRERAWLTSGRAGVCARWRLGRFTVGAALEVDQTFRTPTYSKSGASAEIFRVPSRGVSLGAVIAADL